MSSKIFFCLTVFFTNDLSFQKSFFKDIFSNSLSFVSISSLSKIPPNIT